jgi:hypothetical protein
MGSAFQIPQSATRTQFISVQQGLVEFDFHGTGRACHDTPFAGTAFFLVENDVHFGPFDAQGPCGANRRAGAALIAFLFVSFNILADAFYLDADMLEVRNPSFVILFVTAKLQHHEPLFSRVNDGLEDIEREIEFLDKRCSNGFVNNGFGKPE